MGFLAGSVARIPKLLDALSRSEFILDTGKRADGGVKFGLGALSSSDRLASVTFGTCSPLDGLKLPPSSIDDNLFCNTSRDSHSLRTVAKG